MKLRSAICFSVIILSAFLSGCHHNVVTNNDEENSITGSGNIISITKNVAEFDEIKITNIGSVYLSQSDSQSIRIETDDNIAASVIANSNNGVLNLGLEDGSYSNITLNIYVSLKQIKKLSIKGAANFYAVNSINCDAMDCSIDGVGNIKLIGNCNNFVAKITGSGNIDAFNFKSKNCEASVVGAGNCSVFVSNKLNALVSGVGSIIYDGNPAEVQSTITGVGSIVRK